MSQHDSTDYRARSVLITGGLGFIGSNLARRLVALGANVIIFDHMSRIDGSGLKNFRGIEDRIKLVIDDIRNVEAMKQAVTNIDFIFNLAGQAAYTDSNSDPQRDFDISCLGHLAVLEACRERNPGVRIVFASSRMVYRRAPQLPVVEREPTEPLTIYGIHKLTAEGYHRLYANNHGLKTVCLRITNPYGPLQRATSGKYGLVNWFLRLATQGQPLTVFGDGAQLRDYLYIDDLVEVMLRAGMLKELTGQVFNAGKGEGTRFRDMADAVVSTVGRGSVQSVPWPENYARFETGDFVADVAALTREIGYRPQTTLSDGLARTLAFFRLNEGWD